MARRVMTSEQIRKAGMAALDKALGPDGMVRFMQQFTPGKGDYTAMRQQILGDRGFDEIRRDLSIVRAKAEKLTKPRKAS